MTRLTRAWSALKSEQRLAGIAALLMFVAMFLPWYQQNGVVKNGGLVSHNLSAFNVFSFVEAAVLLVALAVLYLLFARAERRSFHLPGSDGTVVLIAGGWVALLLVWRLFDKPGISHQGIAANVGIQWGIFFALGAAGLLAYAGSRMRAAQQPDPPFVRHRRPRPAEQTLTIAAEPNAPAPPAPPSPRRPERPAADVRRPDHPPAPPTATTTVRPRPSRRAGTSGADETEQLSFDDHERPEPSN
jgi:hypothetical protein